MQITSRKINQRITRVHCTLSICFVGIISVLFYLQIYRSENFLQRSKNNFLRHETIESLRGTIFDCTGKPLATNRPVISLVWHGTGKKTLTPQQHTCLQKVTHITGQDFSQDPQLKRHERRGLDHLLIKDIPFDQMSKLAEQITQQENIQFHNGFVRYYPHNELASHVLGYFRTTDEQPTGTMGLEKALEQKLRGSPGTLEKIINSLGTSIQTRKLEQASAGKNIYTTISFELQSIAESLFTAEQKGTLLVMDPHTGDLQVLMSHPAFDPNIFLKPISASQWDNIKNEQPFINRSLNACYPPASLFKLVTTAVGLEHGIIDTQSTWTCKGHITFGGRPYLCNRRYDGHGEVTIESALAQSCNIPFYEIGKQITIDMLADYAHRLGLGTKTGSLLPERSGLVPTSEWKQLTYGEPWWQGETLNAVIGQGPFLTTPLQMARAIGGICTGKLVRPRILLDELVESEPINISLETLSFLRQSMQMTVQEGTGKYLKKLEDIEIYAKTGTAQTSHRSKRKLGKQFLEHAWFVCYAQYKDYHPIVLVILIEHVGTARFATRMARTFLTRYCQHMDRIAGQN